MLRSVDVDVLLDVAVKADRLVDGNVARIVDVLRGVDIVAVLALAIERDRPGGADGVRAFIAAGRLDVEAAPGIVVEGHRFGDGDAVLAAGTVDAAGHVQLAVELRRARDRQRILGRAGIALAAEGAAGTGDVQHAGHAARRFAAFHGIRAHHIEPAVIGAVGVHRAAVDVAFASAADASGALHIEAAAEQAVPGCIAAALGIEVALDVLRVRHREAAAAADAEIVADRGHGHRADRLRVLHPRHLQVAIQTIGAQAGAEGLAPCPGVRCPGMGHAVRFRGLRNDRKAGGGQRRGQEHQALERHFAVLLCHLGHEWT